MPPRIPRSQRSQRQQRQEQAEIRSSTAKAPLLRRARTCEVIPSGNPLKRTGTTFGAVLSRPNRTVATKINASVAVERALAAGDELEDALWLGEERLDGDGVRQQLHRGSLRGSGRSLRGSQRFVRKFQSIKFWGDSQHTSKSKRRGSSLLSRKSKSPPRHPLEYNGGQISHHNLVVDHANQVLPKNANTPTRHTRRTDAMRQQQMLLSMRCEASRSFRRQRNGKAIIDWLKEEPLNAAKTTAKTTVKTAKTITHKTNNIIPWTKSTSSSQPKKLQRKYLQQLMECQGQDDIMVIREMTNSGEKKKSKKRWRLWLPHRKEPIELVHPNDYDSAAFTVCEQAPALPAHIQLKQQLAKQQRQTKAQKASRNLDRLQFTISEDDEDEEEFERKEKMDRSNSMRSTRLGVHNKPLLVRRPGVANRGTSFGTEDTNAFDDDEQTILEEVPRHRGSNVLDSLDEDSVGMLHNFVPRQVQMKEPKSRFSLLVTQISGLSLGDDSERSLSARGGAHPPTVTPTNKLTSSFLNDQSQTSVYGVSWDDDDDDSENNFYNVQELLDKSRAEQLMKQSSRRRTLGLDMDGSGSGRINSERGFAEYRQNMGEGGNALHYFWDEDGGLLDEHEEGHSEFHNLSTNVHASSRRTSNPQAPNSPMCSANVNSTSKSLATSYRRKQSQLSGGGMIRLECLEEVEEDMDLTESSDAVNENPLRGVDHSFGGSTRKFRTSSTSGSSTSATSIQARSGSLAYSLASTHASHDSSCSFETTSNTTTREQKMGNGSFNSSSLRRNAIADNSEKFMEEEESNHSNTSDNSRSSRSSRINKKPKPRRSTLSGDSSSSTSIKSAASLQRCSSLSNDALMTRQGGMRGGILADYAKEVMDDSIHGRDVIMSALDDDSNNNNLLGRRRSSTSLMSNSSTSLSQSQTNILEAVEEEEEKKEAAPALAPASPQRPASPSKSSKKIRKCTSLPVKLPTEEEDEEEQDEETSAQGLERTRDWWKNSFSEDGVEGFENLWQKIANNDEVQVPTTNADWWTVNDNEALQQTQSFVSNLIVVWDEDGEKDPFIYVGETTRDGARLSLPTKLEEEDHEESLDSRSVCSEPAQMGKLDACFHAAAEHRNNPEKNPYLMAWDDLALL